MNEHWESFGPPVYVSVAGYLGLITNKKPNSGSSPQAKGGAGSLNDLAKSLGPGGVLNG